MPVPTLVRMASMRWPTETAFEETKVRFVMDHHEVCTWLGWHDHMTMCLLAHHFQVRTHKRLKENSSADLLAGAAPRGFSLPAQVVPPQEAIARFGLFAKQTIAGESWSDWIASDEVTLWS